MAVFWCLLRESVRPAHAMGSPHMTRRPVKANVRAALLVLVPALFAAILAPRASRLQVVALALVVLALGYLVAVWLLGRRSR